jgi:ATP synthase protein I
MDSDTKKTFKTLGTLSTVGLVMAISIALGALIGYYLDKRFHTEPWLFFVFLGFGIVAAFKNLFRMVKKVQDIDSSK